MLKNFIKKILSVPAVKNIKFPRSSSGEFLLRKTDFGIIKIDIGVVEKIANRALASVNGIQDSELRVESFSQANPLKIRLEVSLLEGFSAPKFSQLADSTINKALKESLLLDFYVPVDVKVRQIAKPLPTKKRRVR